MKVLLISLTFLLASGLPLSVYAAGTDDYDHQPLQYERGSMTEDMLISRGGQLYDNWWRTTTDTEKPDKDHPLWITQSTNKRTGYDTFRCKECHGWDYRGKEGAYGKGSHYTGFRGVVDASEQMTVHDLKAALKGATNGEHDFRGVLSEHDISDLAFFLKNGIIDLLKFVNTDGAPVGGDIDKGRIVYTSNCMTECHGPEGTLINFGSEDKPEYVSTIANDNPWEFIHKVRAGQPGTRMTSGIINRWSDENIRDLLAYSRTLPEELPKTGWFGRLLGSMGIGEKGQKSYIHEQHRGFGPKKE